ncbi:hypothetical protein [Parabacteroides bouchesdurhonensis]|uniref:hypothetical protein n=1 Tax=Parabacteroides bouchesdurhonensis TaxID=1936995 RepID=UPI00164E41D6|nr:hypothetical protein [Parabacteroides bouchesdurhonensis]
MDDTEKADNVSAILRKHSLSFTVAGFTAVHRRIFGGVFKFAGKIRDFTKIPTKQRDHLNTIEIASGQSTKKG